MNVRQLISIFESNPVSAALLLAFVVLALLGALVVAYVGIRTALDAARAKREARARRQMRRIEHERRRRER